MFVDLLTSQRVCLAAVFLVFTLPTCVLQASASPPPVEDISVPAAVGVLGAHRTRTKVLTPPAGRDTLYRPGILQPWDFPPEIANNPSAEWDYVVNNPRRFSIMGPPGFWTEAALRKQYETTKQFRFAPELFPESPPFEVWLKEQQMLRIIKMHEDTVKQQLLHRGSVWTVQDALAWELNRAEQLIIFRQLQISIVLKYATLDPLVRDYEVRMYRFWAGFLENFRSMNIAYFDSNTFLEQLEGSNKILETNLDQYLRHGGMRTDPAYQELSGILAEAQRTVAELRNPSQGPLDLGRGVDHARSAPGVSQYRPPLGTVIGPEREVREVMGMLSFDDALRRLGHLAVVDKAKPII